jgi:hemerythrin superfamily protein
MEARRRNSPGLELLAQVTKRRQKMATRTRSSSTRNGNEDGDGRSRSSFAWAGNQTGMLAAAAVAGAAVGLAANYGRKMVIQGLGAGAGDWAETLAAEHKAVLALFDKIEATEDGQTWMRAYIFTKIRNALGKHALEEENAVYPALREANDAHDADALNAEHGYVKTYLYELDNMPKSSPEWIERIRDFRDLLEEHMRMEEDEVFPRLRAQLGEEQNAKLSAAVAREGMKLA